MTELRLEILRKYEECEKCGNREVTMKWEPFRDLRSLSVCLGGAYP